MLRTIGEAGNASQSRPSAVRALAIRSRSAASKVPTGEWMMSLGMVMAFVTAGAAVGHLPR